jgi:hypothetical protein
MTRTFSSTLNVQVFIGLLALPLGLLAYLTYSGIDYQFQDINWSAMTLYKMTQGGQLTTYFSKMYLGKPTVAFIFLVLFTLLVQLMYGLILAVVCEQFSDSILVEQMKTELDFFRAFCFCRIKKEKAQRASKEAYQVPVSETEVLGRGFGHSFGKETQSDSVKDHSGFLNSFSLSLEEEQVDRWAS